VFFNRVYCLNSVPTVEDLADKLLTATWCLCTAFRLDGHHDTLFLNDSTSPDGIQEYAVVRHIEGAWYQVNSISFGWIDNPERAASYLTTAISGGYDADKEDPEALCFHDPQHPCAFCR
jgi:hypothetical protein